MWLSEPGFLGLKGLMGKEQSLFIPWEPINPGSDNVLTTPNPS